MDYTKEENVTLGRIADAAYTAGNPDGECAIHEALDVLSGSIVTEVRLRDAAWARFVKADWACARWTGSNQGAQGAPCILEYDAAKQALRDLGVPVDSLLGGDR